MHLLRRALEQPPATHGEHGVADEPFSIENEQLTPSLKIRRHVISKVYGDRLAGLYRK